MSQQLDLFNAGDTQAGRAIREAADDLPALAREMVAVMGHAATMALVHEMGGLRLLVPGWPLKRPSSRYQHLEEIVGPQAAQSFAERWGGIEVQVPMAKKALMRLRDRSIIDAYANGAPPPELAKRYGMTERHLWKVLKRDLSA